MNAPPASRAAVLFVSHRHRKCGIQQYGRMLGAVLRTSQRYAVHYLECESAAEYRDALQRTRPEVVLYNYYWLTMPWLSATLIHEHDAAHVSTIHEVTPQEAAAAHRDVFDAHLAPDPTLVTGNPLVFAVPRLVPDYRGGVTPPDVPTFGSFGFGFADKGFERVVELVQREFDEAVVRLHLPFSHYADRDGQQAIARARRCRELVTKPGVRVEVTHEFLDLDALLDWLAGNHLNVFLYDVGKRRGISSVLDLALAVRRPIAINRCGMFRHLFAARPSICVEDQGLRAILAAGTAPLEPFWHRWNAANVLRAYEAVFDAVLGARRRGRGQWNRVLDARARQEYRGAVGRLFALVPEMMARKIPDANVQQAFMLAAVERFAAEHPRPRILCVGAYEDTACAALERLGYAITKVDPVLNCDLATFCRLPATRTDSYDVVFATSVLEHVADDATFVRQIVALLAPGGVAVLTCDFREGWRSGDPLPPEDLRFYTQHDLRERLVAGLHDVELVDEPAWHDAAPDFTYAGCHYAFATLVLRKLAAHAEATRT